MNFQYETNKIFMKDPSGKLLAEVTFPEVVSHIVNINHTFVDESLKGQGIAALLLAAAASQLRSTGCKAVLTCSYAIHWFEKHPEYRDILAESE